MMFRSIQWKFITIYFLLVFMAMVIVGVFILQQFEEYHLGVVSGNLERVARNTVLPDLSKINGLDANQNEVQSMIKNWQIALSDEISVVNTDFKIIASSNDSLIGKNVLDIVDEHLLLDGRAGRMAEGRDFVTNQTTGEVTPVKNIIFPIEDANRKIQGILYFRSDLGNIYTTLENSKDILIEATALALFITVVLGFFIARSVTEPITDVTVKAAKMAKGDFDQVVEVKSDDEIGQLASMFNYLTEKLKDTLSEISSEKSKMETILNYMADGLIAVNMQGHVIHANPSAMKMLNLSKHELICDSYDDLIRNLNESLTLDYLSENNPDWEGSEIIRINDSIYQANYAPFKDEKDEKAGIVMVLQDITERQKLDNMRKEFVANVSHELKTPLTSIKSYTETLLDGALENKEMAEQFLKVVDSEADRMTRLVRDLLQLSSLDYKQVKWNKKDYDLVKIVKNSVMKVEMTAKNKSQTLEYISQEDSMPGYFDSDRIEQVILNIVSNAIKYTPEEGQIKVFLECKENQGIIRVVDNGMGIPKEDIPRLFERFYRVDKARSREMGGTGLGLSIARQIVEAHNGSIRIDSEYGEGTEVIIQLPLEEKVV
ncbi:two-component system sensor histidine kinase VicK [Anaerosolibacter carboniphilus]|uniref:histidine kinase n=2 Tax=Anaerosolibacter carboniphilus TaxID=1417629 RepID=A0A841KR09_9FIRM|nr:two-component system sensor histidine kinase VicK [Anaerosolibacter carboniphilus]